MKAIATVGLLALSFNAWAQPPSTPGLTGPLGEELFYNYIEGQVGAAYVDKVSGRNQRVASDSAYGFAGSVFLFDPVYVNASYNYTELSFNVPATTGSAQSRRRIEAENISAGLGLHIPVGYATDLFGVVSYELVDGRERDRAGGVTATRRLDAEGIGYEAGLRSFVSGFAELSISYRYRDVREERRDPTFGKREVLEDKYVVMGLVVPVLTQLSLFGRAEIGEADSNFPGADGDFQRYLVGARINFHI